MTKEWGRETACKRNKTARTAREQVGSGKSRMGRVTDQVPACRVAPPLSETVNAMNVGDGFEPNITIGPLINIEAVERSRSMLPTP